MKKAIPVLIAIVLILIIGGAAVGSYVLEKYSYSKEEADLTEYFQIEGEQIAIIYQDEMIEEKAIRRDGVCYFDLDTVHNYLNEIFYADKGEGLLLYTTATEVITAAFSQTVIQTSAGSVDLGYVPVFVENEKVYVAVEYVKQYTNFSYDLFDRHMQVTAVFESNLMATVERKTAVRLKGGVKSPVLRQLEKGETVEILEEMETWSKIKTSDAYIGYVENKMLGSKTEVDSIPVNDYVAPEYTSLSMDGKVSLAWHSIGGTDGNNTLDSMVSGANGMNVIAPTWFSLSDNEGNIRSFASASYVEKAHAYGLKVWGVLDNFNYKNENKVDISAYEVLSVTSKRQKVVDGIVEASLNLSLDGINIDFEQIGEACGIHFVQFLRELSIKCRENGLILSVDNYVPFHFNEYYRLDIQGMITDYVIIMGYDEHWSGSGDPGSVASINYVESGIIKTKENVPAEKVVNALPFYSILWKTEGAVVTDEYLTIRNTKDFLSRVNAEIVWDEETCQNYGEWTSGNGTYQIWLEDADSIAVKLNVMSVQEIGGVAVWRIGGGNEEVWSLIRTYLEQ
ncbi:SH3 domain-containing protein [Lachnospiraceae bacterium OttesenSCG-928-D06]|nr:SH3 domain-containing protein [Lachnospiraceae bacterium OttesenSCG-928-D06]